MERTTSNIIKANKEWQEFRDNIDKMNEKKIVNGDEIEISYKFNAFGEQMSWKFVLMEDDKVLSSKFEDIWDLEKAFMNEIKKGREYTTTIRMSRLFYFDDIEIMSHRVEAVICAVWIEVKKNDLHIYPEERLAKKEDEEIKNSEYCNICGFRIDSFGMERHDDWCPKLNEGVSN